MYYEIFRQMKKQLGQLDVWFDAAEAHVVVAVGALLAAPHPVIQHVKILLASQK